MKFGSAALVFLSLVSACDLLDADEDTGASSTALLTDPMIQNSLVRVTLSRADGSLSVKVKSTGYIWTQTVAQPYTISSITSTSTSITALARLGGESLRVTYTLTPAAAGAGFTASVTSSGERYLLRPNYPYPFTMPEETGYYVQTTTQGGLLFPLSETRDITGLNDFLGYPWWGLTDMTQAMMTILESDYSTAESNSLRSVDKTPIELRYVFMESGTYVDLARYYRNYFFDLNPGLAEDTLASRSRKPGFRNFKDGVYVYFWGPQAQNGTFMTSLYNAGLTNVIAMIYPYSSNLDDEQMNALFTTMKGKGWTVGTYDMFTSMRKAVESGTWYRDLLTGVLGPVAFYAAHREPVWDGLCMKHLMLQEPSQADLILNKIAERGSQATYFDTLIVQLAPCLDASHEDHRLLTSGGVLPATIEENRDYRMEFLDEVRRASTAVGSGEGISQFWAIPHLDYFEGGMMVRLYGSVSETRIGSGDYNLDFRPATDPLPPGMNTDEQHRIPLMELMFHDHIATTWDWRNTNFQHLGTYRKKDLLNALYGTMPMWNMTSTFWSMHRQKFLNSYAFTQRSRSLIGFDDMIDHGYLSTDKKVQYTTWASGIRIIANFDETARTVQGTTIPALDFVIDTTP